MNGLRIFFALILGILNGLASAAPIPSTSFDFGQTAWDPGNGIIELSPGTTPLAVSTPTSTVSFGVTYVPIDGTRQLKINGMDGGLSSIFFIGSSFTVSAGSAISWIETYADRDSIDGKATVILNNNSYDLFGQAESGLNGHLSRLVNITFNGNGTLSNLGLGCFGTAFCFADDFRYGAPRTSVNGLPSDVSGVFLSDVTPTPFIKTAPSPEPSTYALMIGGLALLAVTARRRKLAPSPI